MGSPCTASAVEREPEPALEPEPGWVDPALRLRALTSWCTVPPSGIQGSGHVARSYAFGVLRQKARDLGTRAHRAADRAGGGRVQPSAAPRVSQEGGDQELEDLQNELPGYLRNLVSDDANVLVWHTLLLPEETPYNHRAFNVCISFPKDYPLKPPTVTFTTRIYHPNVDSNGQVCLPITSKENWKPYTKAYQVLEALNMLVNKPDLEQPVRVELADLLIQDPLLFHKNAEDFTLKFGEARPS